jgi:hypothetical protein
MGSALRFSIVAALALMSGCTWKIIPPKEASSPVSVQISEYGRHTRLALPDESGRHFIEYGFGEWNYYGLEKRGNMDGLRALLGLGQGAFSRRVLPATQKGIFNSMAAGAARSESIQVESSKVSLLRDRLETRWKSNAEHLVTRSWDSVPVSRDPARYHLFNNSNLATARWLEELGCEIQGLPVDANFALD